MGADQSQGSDAFASWREDTWDLAFGIGERSAGRETEGCTRVGVGMSSFNERVGEVFGVITEDDVADELE